ncbi:alpha/beta hydrolase [Bradyrhizobium sp. CB2312]|nr:alpha/beta hydrolase [Bradyrhizobium sp. CB2312]WFU76902.1 alpha/beta hydrolase [Bradyrhizobium sp. CB2312]
MDGGYWPHGSCDGAGGNLVRLRRRASEFFESLPVAELASEAHRQLWISDWARVAEDYRTLSEFARAGGSSRIAREAWMCSQTAIEVARTLSCREDIADAALADKVATGLKSFEDDAGLAIDRVEIDCFGQEVLAGFFVQGGRRGPCAPAVICVSDEDITRSSMMRRLPAALRRRNMSLLLIDACNSSHHRSFKPEHMLQCCLDYLEARPDVDRQRIAIYGEGAAAPHASRLALWDRRIAAAVCDGGLLTQVMRRAPFRWMTGLKQSDQDGSSTGSMLPSHRLSCPLLVVVGSRSMVREREARELQTLYRQAGADCSIVVPNRIPHPLGEVENFIAVDDFIFEWLDSKLGAGRQLDRVTDL